MFKYFLALLMCSMVFGEETPKLCLTMIVKNESAIIERCLSSVKEIVDYVCICDTGSSDNTAQIVEAYLQKNGIPGKVFHHEWKNFGHNRTLSAKAAQQFLCEIGAPLSKTYLLLLDADMRLMTLPSFDKRRLTAGAYFLKQKNNGLSYYNLRLLQASLPWECIGPTHEYWNSKELRKVEKIDTAWIDDRDDGGCKSDKFERDIRLLKQALEESPSNARYMFYLAQSYMCSGNYDEAIQWYQKRLVFEDCPEESWIARMSIGECFAAKRDWDKALHWYLEAFQYRPTRAEPFAKIAQYYLDKGDNELAYFFAKQGLLIPYPNSDVFFVSDPVYEYVLDQIVSIAAFYCNNGKEDGLASLDRLILKKSTPDYLHSLAYTNLRFYLHPLPHLRMRPIVFSLPKVSAESNLSYVPTNPSILKTEDGYVVICRTVNYVQKNSFFHTSVDTSDPTLRTRNFLLTYSKDLKLLSQKEIFEPSLRKKHEGSRAVGLEDCRIFATPRGPQYSFTCTACDVNPGFIPQICLCSVDGNKEEARIEKCVPLKGPNPDRCEKNWLPFYKDGALRVIYSFAPFTLLGVDEESGECHCDLTYEPSHDFSAFRGSAAPIAFDDGYLMMVHEYSTPQPQERIYAHRFVYLDKAWRMRKVSHPFCFRHSGVEFCGGMTLDHSGNNLLMTYGIEDSAAYIGSVDVKTVRALLHDLP